MKSNNYSSSTLPKTSSNLAINLRAELLKKSQEFNEAKAKQKKNNSNYILAKNNLSLKKSENSKTIKAKDKTKIKSKNSNLTEGDDDVNLLNQSEECLNRKSQIYEELCNPKNIKSAIKHSDTFLVDFEQKIVTNIKMDNTNDDNAILNNTPTEDSNFKQKIDNLNEFEEHFEGECDDFLHYQEARGREVRDVGVGYYNFSTIESVRREEMTQLKQAHEETAMNINKRRDEIIEEGRQKQSRTDKEDLLMQHGMQTQNIVTPTDNDNQSSENIINNGSNIDDQTNELNNLIDSIRESSRKRTERAWDKGKKEAKAAERKIKLQFKFNDFIEKKRLERNPEFAPLDDEFN